MARNCPQCDRYLGASVTCIRCDEADAPWSLDEPSWAPTEAPPTKPVIEPADRHGAGHHGRFSLRGLVVDGAPVRQRFLPGTMPIRLALIVTWAALLYLKARDVVFETAWYIFWWAFPLIVLWLVLAVVATKLRLGGCLFAGFRLAAIGAPRARDDGWRLVVASGPTATEAVVVAGTLPVARDHEILVNGPLIRGIRHAWLVQGVTPTSFTRLARGLPGTALLVVVLVPQIGWLLIR